MEGWMNLPPSAFRLSPFAFRAKPPPHATTIHLNECAAQFALLAFHCCRQSIGNIAQSRRLLSRPRRPGCQIFKRIHICKHPTYGIASAQMVSALGIAHFVTGLRSALATALSATAGIFGINRSIFLTCVIAAKVMRNWVLLLILNIARSFEVL